MQTNISKATVILLLRPTTDCSINILRPGRKEKAFQTLNALRETLKRKVPAEFTRLAGGRLRTRAKGRANINRRPNIKVAQKPAQSKIRRQKSWAAWFVNIRPIKRSAVRRDGNSNCLTFGQRKRALLSVWFQALPRNISLRARL